MKREAHSQNIRNKILHTTRRLFMSQGYYNTTIRQITKECDIKIGTLYHFYKDKEDILLHITEKIFDNASLNADKDIAPADSCYRFVKEFIRHLRLILTDDQSTELYQVAYNSYPISKWVVEKRNERNKELFKKYNPDFSEEDFMIRTLFIKGYMHALANEKINNRVMDFDLIIERSIRIMLNLFNIPSAEIEQALSRARALNAVKETPHNFETWKS